MACIEPHTHRSMELRGWPLLVARLPSILSAAPTPGFLPFLCPSTPPWCELPKVSPPWGGFQKSVETDVVVRLMKAPHSGCLVCVLATPRFQSSVCLGRLRMVAQVLGPLPHMWGDLEEFPAPHFGLAYPWLMQVFGE